MTPTDYERRNRCNQNGEQGGLTSYEPRAPSTRSRALLQLEATQREPTAALGSAAGIGSNEGAP